jgi:hypothetical protein
MHGAQVGGGACVAPTVGAHKHALGARVALRYEKAVEAAMLGTCGFIQQMCGKARGAFRIGLRPPIQPPWVSRMYANEAIESSRLGSRRGVSHRSSRAPVQVLGNHGSPFDDSICLRLAQAASDSTEHRAPGARGGAEARGNEGLGDLRCRVSQQLRPL